MRAIISPAKKMVVDTDSFPVDGLPHFSRDYGFRLTGYYIPLMLPEF